MKEKGFGGGHTITGLNFEKETDILELLRSKKDYKVESSVIYYKDKEIILIFSYIIKMDNNSINTQDLYNNYLEKNATLKSEIKEVSGDIFTNDRKTHYEDEQIYGLYGLNWWYVLFAWIYGIIVVSFFICIFFVYSNYTLTRKIIILILLVIYPFICTRLAIYFIKIWNYIGSLFPKIAVLKF